MVQIVVRYVRDIYVTDLKIVRT